ncbi:hypothetical protein Taro_046162 [Colocasia esculenta]|uniref:Uncharacterized protein n=1 Tax=Colocasia esculenta TaxID=4460 RepID=A0A843WYC2_COLES|nr:hypothetical protein [Colocasia esculenta]
MGRSSRAKLNMTSDRRDRLTPCCRRNSDSHHRGRRYCQKILETGRSSAGIAILEPKMEVFRVGNDILSPEGNNGDDERLCVTIPNWGLISNSVNRAENYVCLSEGVSVYDHIRSLRPRSRRRIWVPDRKSSNRTLCRPSRSVDSELGPRGRF